MGNYFNFDEISTQLYLTYLDFEIRRSFDVKYVPPRIARPLCERHTRCC